MELLQTWQEVLTVRFAALPEKDDKKALIVKSRL